MKKLSILISAAILIMSGCSKTDDLPGENMQSHQLKSGDTRTVNSYWNPEALEAYFPLECGGELVDWLEPYDGSIECHMKIHYKNGKVDWIQINAKGSAKSIWTGEIYHINELSKIYLDENEELEDFIARTHARGENGNNIILETRIIDFFNFEFEIVKAVCTDK